MFIVCAATAMGSLYLMGLIANKRLPKGERLQYPPTFRALNALPGTYKRLFPRGLLNNVLYASVMGTAVFAGLMLIVELWNVLAAK